MDGQVAGEARPLRERVALALGWRHDPAWRGIGTWIAPDGKMYQSPPELTTDFALSLLDWKDEYEFGRLPDGTYWFQIIGGEGADGRHVIWRGKGATFTEALSAARLTHQEDLSARQAPTVQLDTSPKTE